MIFIKSKKNKTKHRQVGLISDPEWFYLPLDAYGGIMQVVVSKGQQVNGYQKVALLEGKLKTAVHTPTSGTVSGVEKIRGKSYLVIRNDFKNSFLPVDQYDHNILNDKDKLEIIAQNGIEGSGGAGFPVFAKYNIGDRKINTFIVNAVECEPFLKADYALLKFEFSKILKALEIIQQLIKAEEIVFGIEEHNKDLKKDLEREIKKSNLPILIKWLPDKYPQGGELQLIRSATGIELRKGSIPADSGIIVSNIGTLRAIYHSFYEGVPYTERIVTVANKNSSHNYLVKIGTPVEHILNQTQIAKRNANEVVILGGPMMGKAVRDFKIPIGKGTAGLIVLNDSSSDSNHCIECGYCVDVCPQRLMPLEFARYYEKKDSVRLKDFNLQDCIECGACAYVCPSDVPLMKSIFKGKELISK